jgi:hypothetical protein
MQRASVLRIGLIGALGLVAACSAVAPRRMLAPLPDGSSTERPPWLRELPARIERHPAPEGWGGDHMAALSITLAAG